MRGRQARGRVVLGSVVLGLALAGAGRPAPQGGDFPGPLLLGRAILPAPAYQTGPPAGVRAHPGNGFSTPFPSQPLPGFSALIAAGGGEYWALPDNGFGSRAKSVDFLLRLYRVRPDFRTFAGGSGTVEVRSYISLRDPQRHIPFALTRPDRALTGADVDPESVRRAADGTFWFGDEYGPFLLHTDADGVVLEPPRTMPGVISVDHPAPSDPAAANLRASRGIEALAAEPARRYLYPMLEGALSGEVDPRRRLVREFDTEGGQFTERMWAYRVDAEFPGAMIADLAAVDTDRFVLIERDSGQGMAARHKKVYLIDLRLRDAEGYLIKQLVVDLLRIPDPYGISLPPRPGEYGVGPMFSLPLQSVESIEVLSGGRVLLANDNNFPNDDGRWTQRNRPDDIELVVVRAPAVGLSPQRPTARSSSALVILERPLMFFCLASL